MSKSIIETIDDSIEKVRTGETLNPKEVLALSFVLNGENPLVMDDNLKNRVVSKGKYSLSPNGIAMLTEDKQSYLVGETYPLVIHKNNGKTVTGRVMLNIEMVALESIDKIEGDTPLEILMGLDRATIIATLRNWNTAIEKKPIEAMSKNDLISEVNQKIRTEEAEIIFEVENKMVIIYKSLDSMRIKVVMNLNDSNEILITESTSEILNTLFV